MIIVNIQGRFGNQMFGFALYRQLVKMGKEVYVDLSHNRLDEQMKKERAVFAIEPNIDLFGFEYPVIDDETAVEYLKNRENRNLLKRWEYRIFPQKCKCYEEKATAVFDKNVLKLDDVYLNGYWQSEKYFADACKEVRQMYRFPDLFTDYQKRMMEEMAGRQSVSVHIRRGDYLNHPEIYGTTTLDYYRSAMAYMQERRENIHFYIFTNDIPWAEQNFEGDNITIVEDSGDLMIGNLDMALMAECKDNIIANSSFSWWGAWLNRNTEKIVIAPKVWEMNQSTKDIWCEDWIKM